MKRVGGGESSLIYLSYQPELYRVNWHSATGENLRMALQGISVPVGKHFFNMSQWE